MNNNTHNKKKTYVNLAIDPDAHKKLKILAANEGKAMKQLIAEMIEDRIQEEKENKLSG